MISIFEEQWDVATPEGYVLVETAFTKISPTPACGGDYPARVWVRYEHESLPPLFLVYEVNYTTVGEDTDDPEDVWYSFVIAQSPGIAVTRREDCSE